MSRWQRENDDRHGGDEADEAKRGRGMGAGVNFPFDRDGQHLPPGDGDKISERVIAVGAKSKSRVGITNCRASGGRRRRGVRFSLGHCRARDGPGAAEFKSGSEPRKLASATYRIVGDPGLEQDRAPSPARVIGPRKAARGFDV